MSPRHVADGSTSVSVADGTSVIPPGWYEDPADPARLRRWDGEQWTQDVLLAPEQAPAAPTAPLSTPPTMQPEYAEPPAQPEPYVQAEPAPAPPRQPPEPPPAPTAVAPPVGQPVPASPAPSTAPPGAPLTTPPTAQAPGPPTIPRPSPPVSQHTNPPSGPVSLPEWSNLPGLTLPPDLSSLPGMESSSVLDAPSFAPPPFAAPSFAEPEQRGLPPMPLFEPPFIPQRPDVQQAGAARPTASRQQSGVVPAPATPYAPPPAGPHYDVPPPPGMAYVPTSGPVLPPSAFVAPQLPGSGRPELPPVGSLPSLSTPVASAAFASTPRGVYTTPPGASENLGTVSSWLIAALPLVQFAAIYVVFGILHVALVPGMQWGILAAPAAFSLLLANADKKKLTDRGASSPSIILGLVAPLYLIARCITTGRSSVLPLVTWVVLQAGAAAGVYFLLPTVLSAAIRAIG
jgi:hypothetical protein